MEAHLQVAFNDLCLHVIFLFILIIVLKSFSIGQSLLYHIHFLWDLQVQFTLNRQLQIKTYLFWKKQYQNPGKAAEKLPFIQTYSLPYSAVVPSFVGGREANLSWYYTWVLGLSL